MDEVPYTVILDMSSSLLISTDGNAFLESYMNVPPCLCSQQVTICCPMQSVMHLFSDVHIIYLAAVCYLVHSVHSLHLLGYMQMTEIVLGPGLNSCMWVQRAM